MNAPTLAQRGHSRLAEAKRTGRPLPGPVFMRIDDVIATTGLSRRTIYRLAGAGDLPRPTRITRGCSGWWSDQIEAFLRARREGG